MLIEIFQSVWVNPNKVVEIYPSCEKDGWITKVVLDNDAEYDSSSFDDRKSCVELCDEIAKNINLALSESKQERDHIWTSEEKPSQMALDSLRL